MQGTRIMILELDEMILFVGSLNFHGQKIGFCDVPPRLLLDRKKIGRCARGGDFGDSLQGPVDWIIFNQQEWGFARKIEFQTPKM